MRSLVSLGVWLDDALEVIDLMAIREAYTTPGLIGRHAPVEWIRQLPAGGPIWCGSRSGIARVDPESGSVEVLDLEAANLGKLRRSWPLGPDAILVHGLNTVTEWRRSGDGEWHEHARLDGPLRQVAAIDGGSRLVLTEPTKPRVWFVDRTEGGFGKPVKLDHPCDELEIRVDADGRDRVFVRQVRHGLGRVLRAGAWEVLDDRRG